MAKWLGGGLGPHDVRAWPEWSVMQVLLVMRGEAAT